MTELVSMPWGGVDWESEGAADRVGQACRLFALVKQFRDENGINCSEAIYQTDHVIENAYEFIEALVETIGYSKEEDQ